MNENVCTRCGKPFPQCNYNRPSFLGPEVAAFVAEHGSGDAPERVEALVDRHGRLWAYAAVADAFTMSKGETIPDIAISWFGAEERTTYEGLIGPFTEVRI